MLISRKNQFKKQRKNADSYKIMEDEGIHNILRPEWSRHIYEVVVVSGACQ